MPKRHQISKEEVVEIEKAYRKNKDKNIDRRLEVLLLHAAGKRRSEISEKTDYSEQRITELVVYEVEVLGYKWKRLTRASWVVKCHFTQRDERFLDVDQAHSAVRKRSISPIRRPRHCRSMTLNSISAMFNQLPCLGV